MASHLVELNDLTLLVGMEKLKLISLAFFKIMNVLYASKSMRTSNLDEKICITESYGSKIRIIVLVSSYC